MITLGVSAFWVLLVFCAVIILGCIAENEERVATVVFFIGFFILNFLGSWGLVEWVYHHVRWVPLFLLGYAIGGFCYALFRWIFLVSASSQVYKFEKMNFLGRKGVEDSDTIRVVPLELRKEWILYVETNGLSKTKFSDHINDVTRWATFWVFGLICFVTLSPIALRPETGEPRLDQDPRLAAAFTRRVQESKHDKRLRHPFSDQRRRLPPAPPIRPRPDQRRPDGPHQ